VVVWIVYQKINGGKVHRKKECFDILQCVVLYCAHRFFVRQREPSGFNFINSLRETLELGAARGTGIILIRIGKFLAATCNSVGQQKELDTNLRRQL